MTMLRTAAMAAVVMLLGGCSTYGGGVSPAVAVSGGPATSPASSSPSTPVATPSETGPVELSEDGAGEVFLAATCRASKRSRALNRALTDNFEIDKVSGPAAEGTRAAAKAAAKSMEAAAEKLDDDAVIWPEGLRGGVKRLAQAYYERAAILNQMAAKSFTWDEWRGEEWEIPRGSLAAVRLELGLGAAPKGC